MTITDGEKHILNLLKKRSGYWKFFEVIDNSGNTDKQIKRYNGRPETLAYPDFEKYQEDKIVLMVETKNYEGFFQGRKKTLAMDYKQLREYFVVQREENAEVRIVFVIDNGHGYNYYWETINNIGNMECYYEMYQASYRKVPRKYIYFCADDFRTDINNLGLN
jgi:hypothetical protein